MTFLSALTLIELVNSIGVYFRWTSCITYRPSGLPCCWHLQDILQHEKIMKQPNSIFHMVTSLPASHYFKGQHNCNCEESFVGILLKYHNGLSWLPFWTSDNTLFVGRLNDSGNFEFTCFKKLTQEIQVYMHLDWNVLFELQLWLSTFFGG